MVNSYKRNEARGKKVNSCMKTEELESYAAEMQQTDFKKLHIARQLLSEIIKVQKQMFVGVDQPKNSPIIMGDDVFSFFFFFFFFFL